MHITARFYVESVTKIGSPGSPAHGIAPKTAAEKVVLQAIYASDKSDPNYSYSEATPQARVEMLITNEAAWGAFKPGHSYDAAFTPTQGV